MRILLGSLLLMLAISTALAEKPAAPSLSVSVSATMVTITWSKIDAATGYTLYYAPYPAADSQGSLELGTSLTITGQLEVGAAFYVAVVAYNETEISDYSNIVNFEIVEAVDSSFSKIDLFRQSLANLSIDEFFDVSYKGLLRRDPEEVVALGLSDEIEIEETLLSNISDQYQRTTFDFVAVILDVLEQYDQSNFSAQQIISARVYQWYLADYLDGLPFIRNHFEAAFFVFGIQNYTQDFFTEIHPLANKEDALSYLQRLSLVDTKFQQLIDNLVLSESDGIIEPALTMDLALYELTQLLRLPADESPYYLAFSEAVNALEVLSAPERDELLGDALTNIQSSVIPAYSALNEKLLDLIDRAPRQIGVGQYYNGDQYYEYMLRHLTSTDLTADEIHQLGLLHVQRVQAEIATAAASLGYPAGDTLAQIFQRATSDSGIIDAEDVVALNENTITEASNNLTNVFALSPQTPVAVHGGINGGYYLRGSLDGSRPGAFQVRVADTPYYGIPTIAYHEAVPGHHFQITLAQELSLPLFRNTVRFTGYTEGWALYAERLAWELGWYDNDPYGNLGRLQWELIRAVRLVVDTGIHAKSWGFDQATGYFSENTGKSVGSSQYSAARFSVIPAQANAYMIGMLQILALRERAIEQLGVNFNLMDFHSVVLENGAMPLSILEQLVDQYIAAGLSRGGITF